MVEQVLDLADMGLVVLDLGALDQVVLAQQQEVLDLVVLA